MGINVVPLKNLTPDESKTLTIDLIRNNLQNEKSRGQLVVELVYKPFTDDHMLPDLEVEGWLMVTIEKGTFLTGKHYTSLFVRLVFQGKERETKVCFFNCYEFGGNIEFENTVSFTFCSL